MSRSQRHAMLRGPRLSPGWPIWHRWRAILTATAAFVVGSLFCARAGACPFCTALKPTLSQQRESANFAALAEVTNSGPATQALRVHRVLKSGAQLKAVSQIHARLEGQFKSGTLVLLLGAGSNESRLDELRFSAVPLEEASYAYVARSPDLRRPAAERLRYFVPYLEHSDALVAEDAYLEFGHAPFDQVALVVHLLPMKRVRRWLADPGVPPQRKGFYGLALGLAKSSGDRRANLQFLEAQIMARANDFRSGFDGVLGGYLLLAGTTGLELLETRYLANPRAADGDVRHALTAVRFYHEYGREIPLERQQQALARLLDRPEFAQAAITDLARWRAWSMVDRIAALYGRPKYAQPAIGGAIVGFLKACPLEQAEAQLRRLRQLDPAGVAAAEEVLVKFRGSKSSQ